MTARRTLLAISLLLLASAFLTLFWLGMRSVMDVGGSCASSNSSFDVRQRCAGGGAVAVPLGIVLGLASLGGYVAVTAGTASQKLALAAWPALFVGLGINFVQYALAGPENEGIVWSWLACGVFFALMGIAPVVLARRSLRALLAARRGGAKSEAFTYGRLERRAIAAKLEGLERMRASGELSAADFAERRAKLPLDALQPERAGARALGVASAVAVVAGVGLAVAAMRLLER